MSRFTLLGYLNALGKLLEDFLVTFFSVKMSSALKDLETKSDFKKCIGYIGN